MDRRQITTHIFIAALTACVFYICTKSLISVTESVLITDIVASGIILSALLLFLKNIIAYRHFFILTFRQKVVNYSALAILFSACWIGLEYFILFISFPAEKWQGLYPILPVRILIAILIYTIMVLAYRNGSTMEEEPEVQQMLEEKEEIKSLEQTEILERIAVKNGQKIEVIPVREIACIQAEGDYVMIHSQKGRYLKEQTMKSLEAGLPTDKFARVHRSSIVNVDFIAQIELYDKQNQLLKLKNGVQIKVSQSGYKTLKKTLGL